MYRFKKTASILNLNVKWFHHRLAPTPTTFPLVCFNTFHCIFLHIAPNAFVFLIKSSTINIFRLAEKEKSNSDHQHNNIPATPERIKKLKVAMWCMTQLPVWGHSASAGDVYTCSTAALQEGIALVWCGCNAIYKLWLINLMPQKSDKTLINDCLVSRLQ